MAMKILVLKQLKALSIVDQVFSFLFIYTLRFLFLYFKPILINLFILLSSHLYSSLACSFFQKNNYTIE